MRGFQDRAGPIMPLMARRGLAGKDAIQPHGPVAREGSAKRRVVKELQQGLPGRGQVAIGEPRALPEGR
jgi:hypothetical protein